MKQKFRLTRKNIIWAIVFGVVLATGIALALPPRSSEEDAKKKPETEPIEIVVEDTEAEEPEAPEVPNEPEVPEMPREETPAVEPEEPVLEPEKVPEPQPPKVEAIPGQHRDPNSAVVVIDPGHQLRGDSVKEPNGPGSSEKKARVTGGATGKFTGVPEYELNLKVALKLQAELENRGYTVYMTRTSHEVNISNMERALFASEKGADIAVRIHANGAGSESVNGAETLTPSANNPYIPHLAKASNYLSRCVLDAYCAATGFANRGVKLRDDMTGMNWSEVPVTIVEMGFMSNESDDRAMQDDAMQNNMVQGIANGIDAYFGF